MAGDEKDSNEGAAGSRSTTRPGEPGLGVQTDGAGPPGIIGGGANSGVTLVGHENWCRGPKRDGTPKGWTQGTRPGVLTRANGEPGTIGGDARWASTGRQLCRGYSWQQAPRAQADQRINPSLPQTVSWDRSRPPGHSEPWDYHHCRRTPEPSFHPRQGQRSTSSLPFSPS